MKKRWKALSIITLLAGTIASASVTTRATSDYEENMEPVIWSDETYQEFETGLAETVEVDNPILQGQCGDMLYYTLDREQGILSFDGEGEIYNYETYAELPWAKYYDDIQETVLPEGVRLRLWMMGYDYADRAGRLGDMEALFIPTEDGIEEWMVAEDSTDGNGIEEEAPGVVVDENGDMWYSSNPDETGNTMQGGSSMNRYNGTYSSGYYNTGKMGIGSTDGQSGTFLTEKSSGTSSSYYNRYNNTYDVADKYKDAENENTTKTGSDAEDTDLPSSGRHQNGSSDKDSQTFENEAPANKNSSSEPREDTSKKEGLLEDSSSENVTGESGRSDDVKPEDTEKEGGSEKNSSDQKVENDATVTEEKSEEGDIDE